MNDRKVVFLQDYIFARGRKAPSSAGATRSTKCQVELTSLSTQGIMLGLWMTAFGHIVMAACYQQPSLDILVDSKLAWHRFPQFVD